MLPEAPVGHASRAPIKRPRENLMDPHIQSTGERGVDR